MLDLPFIGPLPQVHLLLNKAREPLRRHIAWISILASIACVALLIFRDYPFLGLSSGWLATVSISVVMALNIALAVADRIWPPVTEVGLRGLTMIDEWLSKNEDWIEPVASWLDACGDLDSRHFMCLRRMVEGPNARPLGPATAHWAILMHSRQDICMNVYDLAGGKVRDHVLWLRNKAERAGIESKTPDVDRNDPRPRRL